jgi:hypothetical protein
MPQRPAALRLKGYLVGHPLPGGLEGKHGPASISIPRPAVKPAKTFRLANERSRDRFERDFAQTCLLPGRDARCAKETGKTFAIFAVLA